ncbi:MAG: hypothetical protein GIW94_12940 [Candidatus Eremiobacteraeota bacterium]|nr:hypothetical protein [Candidatus Eremiobacteraeota bacterium]
MALIAAGAVVALVGAYVAVPRWGGFHAWEYAAALVVLMALLASYALGARTGRDGDVGRWLMLPIIGAFIIGAAGLIDGLLGPDSDVVQRAPGSVAVVSEVRAAAFFPAADAGDIGRGDVGITVRRRNGAALVLTPGSRAYVGATALQAVPRVAAYVEATDDAGERLTVTQPTNPAFLSPVALFSTLVPIGGRQVPADSFAIPARHRALKVFYFAAGSIPGLQARGFAGGPLVLFAVDDEHGSLVPGGIAAAPSGRFVAIGGLRLRATLGTYPALAVSSIPSPALLWLGGAIFLGGLLSAGFALVRSRPPSAPAGGTLCIT